MAHDAFISYSSTDANAALAVLHGLEAGGVRCWMAPRDIKPGAIWAQAIMEGITGARVMVVVFSSSANRSAHVINEVDAAVRKGAVIVPFRIEDVMPDGAMEYHLRTRHWLDALTPDIEQHTTQLAEQIRLLMETRPGGESIPTPPPRMRPEDLPRPRARAVAPARRKLPPARTVRRTAAFAFPLLLAVGWYATRKRAVADVEFTAHEVSATGGNESSLRVTSGSMRFFDRDGSSRRATRQVTDRSRRPDPVTSKSRCRSFTRSRAQRAGVDACVCPGKRGRQKMALKAAWRERHRPLPPWDGDRRREPWRPGRPSGLPDARLVARDGSRAGGSARRERHARRLRRAADIGARSSVPPFEARQNIPAVDPQLPGIVRRRSTRYLQRGDLAYRATGEVVRARCNDDICAIAPRSCALTIPGDPADVERELQPVGWDGRPGW